MYKYFIKFMYLLKTLVFTFAVSWRYETVYTVYLFRARLKKKNWIVLLQHLKNCSRFILVEDRLQFSSAAWRWPSGVRIERSRHQEQPFISSSPTKTSVAKLRPASDEKKKYFIASVVLRCIRSSLDKINIDKLFAGVFMMTMKFAKNL